MSDTTAPKNEGSKEPGKSGWTPPASQEDFDRIIADRLSRERAKYSDYKDLREKAAKFDEAVEAAKSEEQKRAEELAAANARIAEFEQRDQVAAWAKEVEAATGVSAAALRGSSKKELEEHAEQLKDLMKPKGTPVPGAGKTPETKTTPERETVRNLFGPK